LFLVIYLVNLAEGDFFDTLVLDNLAQNTAITTANDQDLSGVRMRVQGDVCHHLLVATKTIIMGE
jgi:hypothetical protein